MSHLMDSFADGLYFIFGYMTELFMTQDRSHDHVDTWDFLDRRLRDVYRAGKVTNDVAQYLGYKAQGVVDMLRSKSVIR